VRHRMQGLPEWGEATNAAIRQSKRMRDALNDSDFARVLDETKDWARAGRELLDVVAKHLADPDQDSDAYKDEQYRVSVPLEAFSRALAIDSTRRSADKAQSAAESSRTAAGEAGSRNLAEHFEALRKSETMAAEVLRVIAAILVIVIVVVLIRLPHEGASVAEILQRAIIAIPAFGLAAYAGAEAGRHRRVSQWAGSLKVQLQTVDAYCEPLPPDEAAEIRLLLAQRAFGELPRLGGKSEEGGMPTGLQPLIELLLVELRSRPR
jgi:hypothetical protein